ncbi:MAG: pectate lyase [Planctomycetes bacterium]|nr:pectate lyase [Planctomycetota bacterium]
MDTTLASLLVYLLLHLLPADTPAPSWNACLRQPLDWYASHEGLRIAENVLLHQRETGGWPKNADMTARLAEDEKAEAAARKGRADSTFDNGATHEQLLFLARAFEGTKRERLKEAFLRGLDFALAAQHANGGWPQCYPLPADYRRRITFNDGAMIGVLEVLRGVARKEAPYAFVDGERRARCEEAVGKGIDCILKCQIVVQGVRTAWCAQHDEVTLAPASARSYEKASLSGGESAGIVRFLMGFEAPPPEVAAAIEAAVRWFREAKLEGIRVETVAAPALPGGKDRVVVKDAGAPPLWARFYEIGTNRPIFCGRDGVVRSSLAEIEHERRVGYAWYSDAPRALLERDYPAWKRRTSAGPPAARS